MILTERARHEATTTVHAAAGAEVTLDEVLVLGRAREAAGALRSTLAVRVDDAPVLLTSIDTSLPAWSGPAGVDGAAVVANRLRLGTAMHPGRRGRAARRRAAPARTRVPAGRRHGRRRQRRPRRSLDARPCPTDRRHAMRRASRSRAGNKRAIDATRAAPSLPSLPGDPRRMQTLTSPTWRGVELMSLGKTSRWALAVIAAFALLVSACGDDSSDESGGSGDGRARRPRAPASTATPSSSAS